MLLNPYTNSETETKGEISPITTTQKLKHYQINRTQKIINAYYNKVTMNTKSDYYYQ